MVKDAALAAVPGITLTGADTEVENGVRVFGLLGMADEEPYKLQPGQELAGPGRKRVNGFEPSTFTLATVRAGCAIVYTPEGCVS